MAPLRARLVGGPHDGDSGLLGPLASPPPILWTVRCDNPRCDMAGVHWFTEAVEAKRASAALEADVERYRFDHRDAGICVYHYADLSFRHGIEPAARKRKPVPA